MNNNNVYLCRIEEDNLPNKRQFDYTLICNPNQYQNETFIPVPKSMKYDEKVVNRRNCGPTFKLKNDNNVHNPETMFINGGVNIETDLMYPERLTKCGINARYVPDMNNSDLYKIKVDKTKQVDMTNKLLFKNQEFCNTYVPPMAQNQTPFHNYSRIELNPFKNPLNK